MNQIKFYKYNATGNDFVVIDNRNNTLGVNNKKLFSILCTPKIGIGADGILLLENSNNFDFRMRYLNADGGEVEMCGNGARTITSFFHTVTDSPKVIYQFETMNSIYQCSLDETYGFKLKMSELYDVDKIKIDDLFHSNHSMYLNTGVPHCVYEVNEIDTVDVYNIGKKIRYNEKFIKGSNVNFFSRKNGNQFKVRTYERGVENETLSCGTGATATAIAAAKIFNIKEEIILETKGGTLAVKFNSDFSEVYLCGKVDKIFEGIYFIS